MRVVLQTRGLKKTYGGVAAVDGVTLQICEGETFGFLGQNGAGKSTFIRMVCGVIAPDDGEIELMGRTADRVPASWRRDIGYVAQEPRFDPWMTPLELGSFVAPFFPAHDAKLFRELLDLMRVPTGKRIESLSVGVRARLAVAVALAHKPRLLILDEPTAGLDPLARRDFHELLERTAAAHPRATFFSSHLVDDIERLAGRIGILDQGALVYDGTIDALGAEVRSIPHDARDHVPSGAMVIGTMGRGPALRLVVRAAAEAWASYDGETTSPSFEDTLVAMLAHRRRAA
jgi:ABC-2 type transport system ATP-binding protein